MNKYIYTLIVLLVCLIIFLVPITYAISYTQNNIVFYNTDTPSGYEFIAETVAVFNTDYWHYSNGYWLDGMQNEERIFDDEDAFWNNPLPYYNRPGMNIMAEGILPEAVKEYQETGSPLIISVIPKKPEAISAVSKPTVIFIGNYVYVKALPLFKLSTIYRYPQFVPDLDKYIPIVRDGYGWNVYSIFRDSVHIGELGSSFTPKPNAIEFTEILDAGGRLQSDKIFQVGNSATGAVTEARADEITIGDDTFRSAGAVGMWFTYEFDVRFYKYKAGDIETVEIISPNRIEAGKETVCVAAIKNNTTISYYGENAPLLRLWDGREFYETVTELSPGEVKEARIPWIVPDAPGTIDITVIINPDKTIDETDYDNNTAAREVLIVAPVATPAPTITPGPAAAPQPVPAPSPQPDNSRSALPDLAVTGLRALNYTALSVVNSYIKVINNSDAALRGVPVSFNDGISTQRKLVDFAPHEEKEIDYEWLTPQAPGIVFATTEINPERSIAETDYSNNKRIWDVRIDPPPVDFSVVSVIPSGYPAGKQVISLINVKNTGNRDFTGNETVELKFSVPSVNFNSTKRISIGKNAECTIPFFWTAPANAGIFQIAAEINPTRAVTETNYSNNVMIINAESTVNPNPPFGCNVSRRDWSEIRQTGGEYVDIIAPDGTTRQIYVPIYENISFYAEVSINARLIPETIKSGYGVECEVTTHLNTNYDNPSLIIPLQEVYAYLPTTDYTEAIKLEPSPGASNRWRFPVNPTSVIGARVQYVPVSWPDGSAYRIGFTARDAQSPGGALCVTAYAQTMVDGNMYEDDYTAPH